MRQKTLLHFIFISITALLIFGCTISHEYGPYKGKVLDKETNEPLEGAVVFMRFFTNFQLSPGGPVSKFVDAVEVMSDKNGEFEIPRQKLQAIRFFHGWDPHGSIIIFKPGYGAYPGHKDVSPKFKPGGTLPEDENVVVWLPKLKTKEERMENQSHASFTSDIPFEKWQNLFRLRNIEREQAGLEPFDAPK
jgi:hypothetical protein